MGVFSYRTLGTIWPRWLRELFLPASGAAPADPTGEGAGADTDGNPTPAVTAGAADGPTGEGAGADTDGNPTPAVSPGSSDGPTGEGAGADTDGDTTPAVTPGAEADFSDLDDGPDLGAYCGVRPRGYRRTYNNEGAIDP